MDINFLDDRFKNDFNVLASFMKNPEFHISFLVCAMHESDQSEPFSYVF